MIDANSENLSEFATRYVDMVSAYRAVEQSFLLHLRAGMIHKSDTTSQMAAMAAAPQSPATRGVTWMRRRGAA